MSTPGPQTHIHSCVCTLHLYHRSSPLAPIASLGPCLLHPANASTPAAAHRPRQHCCRCSLITSALQPPPLHRALLTDHVSTAAAAHRPRQHCSRCWRWKEKEREWQCKQLVPFSPCLSPMVTQITTTHSAFLQPQPGGRSEEETVGNH